MSQEGTGLAGEDRHHPQGANPRILIVDDESGVLRVLEQALTRFGFEVIASSNGLEAIARVRDDEPNLVLLDVVMPDIDGIEVCRRIRAFSTVPILMITGLRNEQDVVTGLEAGADEYITKPFSLAELRARVEATLRRTELSTQAPQARQIVCDGGQLIIDYDRRIVTRRGESVLLSATEFRLLSFLASNAGRVVPHHRILEYVWGSDKDNQAAHLRTYISMLRRKVEEDPRQPRVIQSRHGIGYLLQTDLD